MTVGRPKRPIRLDRVLGDPGLIRRLVETTQPFFPVQRYFENRAQQEALNPGAASLVAPNFRGDWAYDVPQVEGVEPLLHHPGFCDAARAVFDAEVVRPQQVYANLTWQLPFPQGPGHTDVPAFRGVDRTSVPTTWLQVMGASRLFEPWRIDIATAVAWFYEGTDGGFDYWPDGPGGAMQIHEGAIFNTAIVGDNDFMFHRVRPVGSPGGGLPRGLSLGTELVREQGEQWLLREQGRVLARPRWEELRISVSWKAMVFPDAAAARRYDEGEDLLSLDAVFDAFEADLRDRGEAMTRPADPLADAALFAQLARIHLPPPPPAVAPAGPEASSEGGQGPPGR